MQQAVVVADRLTIKREGKLVLNELSFAMAPGKITGLIGPSGSGKTTLMRAIMGTQIITAGECRVLGQAAGNKQLRSRIGYVTQSPAIYDDLTVHQNLQYFATILGCPRSAVARVTQQVDMEPQAKQMVGSLSGGQKARVSLAIALLGHADLLVLDEPTVGLDPVLRKHLWALFTELASQGTSLLISSHVMDEAEQCPELLLLRDGQVLSHSSKQELFAKTQTSSVEAAFLALVEGGHAS